MAKGALRAPFATPASLSHRRSLFFNTLLLPGVVFSVSSADQSARCLIRRAGARHLVQVDTKGAFGDLFPVSVGSNFRHQCAIGIRKFLARPTVAISAVANRLFNFQARVFLASFGQFKRLFLCQEHCPPVLTPA
ncbi:MAG: hypothetical protein GQ526_07665 [Ardenticatenales bacterium]|nr:hypothetical protein [Ardenticatenales bacterium]